MCINMFFKRMDAFRAIGAAIKTSQDVVYHLKPGVIPWIVTRTISGDIPMLPQKLENG